MSDMSILFGVEAGSVMVQTTSNRGFTPEELADNALDKIIYVGSSSHPAIQEQAEAFMIHSRAGSQFLTALGCSNISCKSRV